VWAHGVARELEPLAGDRLPELPAEAAVTEAPAPTPAPAPAAPGEDAPTPFAMAPSAAPRVSRRGGALLIGGVLAAIAVAVVLVLVLTGGDDKKKTDSAATQAAGTTSTAAQPQVRAQINLTPPKNGPAKKALAIVQIVDVSGQTAVNAVSQGLPTSNKKAAYGIWVYTSPSQAKLIGGFDKKDNNGHLVYQGALPKDLNLASYKEILVTLETSGAPTKPGTIYLRGAIQSAAGG
jgi:Anti-sigma-K factor rskA, C-terminal